MKIKRTLGAPLSRAHEAALMRDLRPMIKHARALALKAETPTQARAIKAKLRNAFSDDYIERVVKSRGSTVARASSRPWGPVERIAKRVGVLDAKRQRRRVPYDGRKLLEAWSKEAAALIKSLRDEVAEGVRKDVVTAIEAGTPAAELSAKWVREGVPVEFGTIEGRAKVIARHQLTTLHAQIQSARARALGVTEFIWRTQGDDLVRDEHTALNGTKHEYANPPAEGLPGQPVNCRCWAESVVSDEIANALGVSFLPNR